MNQDDKALTIKEVAKFLNISNQMVYNLIKQKELEAFKIGSAVRVLHSDLILYVKAKKQEYTKQKKEFSDEYINTDDSIMVIHDLSSRLGSFLLDNISITFPRDSILSVLGPSGSGKSMLLRSIAGLQEMTHGDVFLGKKRLDNLELKDRRIGFVFQDYALFPHLSALGNITFPLFTNKMKKAKKEDVVSAIHELKLNLSYLSFKPGELPEGVKQLVAIGREKIRDVDLFLMDEPMAHLDKDKKHVLRMIIKKILMQFNKTTIICLNDPQDALALSNYVAILVDGKVKIFGETQSVYANPQFPDVMEIFSCYGVNKYPVHIRGNKVSALPISAQREDGEYMLYFRAEEIELTGSGNGICGEIMHEHFIDGKNKIVQCRISGNTEIRLFVPVEIQKEVCFFPKNPLFVPVEKT